MLTTWPGSVVRDKKGVILLKESGAEPRSLAYCSAQAASFSLIGGGNSVGYIYSHVVGDDISI